MCAPRARIWNDREARLQPPYRLRTLLQVLFIAALGVAGFAHFWKILVS